MAEQTGLFTLPGDGVARLRGVLDDAGFTAEAFAAVDAERLLKYGRRMAEIVVSRTAASGRLPTLVRLLIGLVAVDEEEARAAFAPVALEDLLAARLLERSPGGIRSCVQVRHVHGMIVAADPEHSFTGRPLADDQVMGVSYSTDFLARITDRTPAGRALDLGTGCGLQALLLRRHADRVVATDVTPRAVAMAGFNARLNGIEGIELRLGDMFEPVTGELFDLIVSNPPFIIAPAVSTRFLSAGLDADELMARMAGAAPRHLVPGGRAHFLGNWIVPDDGAWEARVAPWFEDSGCDVTVLTFAVTAPDEYAADWILPEVADPHLYSATYERWMRWYQAHGVGGVAFGMVTMQRRQDGASSLRLHTPPLRYMEMDGNDLQAALALGRWVGAVDDDEFLASRLVPAPALRSGHERHLRSGDWVTAQSALFVEDGFSGPMQSDVHAERLVARCDGRRTVADLLALMAADVERPIEEVVARTLPAVRNLVERGLLLPAGPPANA